jgi:hypothetical protein
MQAHKGTQVQVCGEENAVRSLGFEPKLWSLFSPVCHELRRIRIYPSRRRSIGAWITPDPVNAARWRACHG